MRIFNIGFKVLNGGAEEPVCDETQFDIEDTGNFSEMMTELMELFNDFCAENDFNSAKVSYIEEVSPTVLTERITVPLSSGFQLVAERNTDPNYRNEMPSLSVKTSRATFAFAKSASCSATSSFTRSNPRARM